MLTISTGFLVVYLIFKPEWALITALICGLIGMFSAKLSTLLEYLWMKLAFVLSLIVPNILLGLIFFLFLFPIALLSKLLRKSDVLKLRNTGSSMYSERGKSYDKAHFENMW